MLTPTNYLAYMNARRQSLTGIQRTWADFNMTMEIIDIEPDYSIVQIALNLCDEIIYYLSGRPELTDALEIKQNQKTDLEEFLRGFE